MSVGSAPKVFRSPSNVIGFELWTNSYITVNDSWSAKALEKLMSWFADRDGGEPLTIENPPPSPRARLAGEPPSLRRHTAANIFFLSPNPRKRGSARRMPSRPLGRPHRTPLRREKVACSRYRQTRP